MKLSLAIALTGAALVACVSTNNSTKPRRDPTEAAKINLQLGFDYMQQGDLATAKEKLERARDEDPRNAEVHGALAILDERLGKDQDADKEFRTALALAPHEPQMLNTYAVYLCSHNRAVEGERYFEQAATNPLYRTPWAAYTNAGVCLHAAHHDPEAAQRFALALQINPAYAEAVYQASDLDFSLKNYSGARVRIEVYLINNAANPDLLLLAYRVALAQSDLDAQQRYAGRLLKEFPGSEQARAVASSRTNPG